MDDLTNDQIEYWAEEFRRLRYGLPPGTTFEIFLVAPKHYRRHALNRVKDWSENPRVMPLAHHSVLCIN